MIKKFITNSTDETAAIAEKIGTESIKGQTYALYGELGTGKTVFARGMAKGLGIDEDITSPTFNLLEIYPGNITLYHFDLYRIEDDEEFDQLFFEEYWDGEGISIIEWADKAGDRLPEEAIKITLEYINNDKRRITIEHPDY